MGPTQGRNAVGRPHTETPQFHPIATHLKGAQNVLADALSRDNLPLFRTMYPQNGEPTGIPEEVLDLLYLREPDWTSKSWTEQWSSSFGMD